MKNIATITQTTWENVRKKLKVINPELAKIIDALNPNKDYTLFTASYPYGDAVNLPKVRQFKTGINLLFCSK